MYIKQNMSFFVFRSMSGMWIIYYMFIVQVKDLPQTPQSPYMIKTNLSSHHPCISVGLQFPISFPNIIINNIKP